MLQQGWQSHVIRLTGVGAAILRERLPRATRLSFQTLIISLAKQNKLT